MKIVIHFIKRDDDYLFLIHLKFTFSENIKAVVSQVPVFRSRAALHAPVHTPRGNSPPPLISMGEGRQRGGGKSGCCRAAEFALPLLTFTLSARTELNEATLTLLNVSSGDFYYLGLHEILHPLNDQKKKIYIFLFST